MSDSSSSSKNKNKWLKSRIAMMPVCCSTFGLLLMIFMFMGFQKEIKSLITPPNNKHVDNTEISVVKLERKSERNNSSSFPSMMKRAIECLRHTKPDISVDDILYPQDAFAHYQEIHQRLEKWTQTPNHIPHSAAGYSGPWIENHWITHFQNELLESIESKNNTHTLLSDIFGPYIPIFIPWTDIWVHNKYKYPKELVNAMMSNDLLRDDVLYITVNQNDDGFVGRCSEFYELQSKKHITIFSAGGYGHIPIPLLKQPEPSLSPDKKIPMNERTHLLSYVGSNKNAPDNMRQKMLAAAAHDNNNNIHYYKGDTWRDVMAQSKFQLCPRGFGRTSYHIQETLQMGLIPIQVYIDQPWLPYYNNNGNNLMKNISFAVTVDELLELINNVVSKLSDSTLTQMEHDIEMLRNDYFSFNGTMKQISKFMVGTRSGGGDKVESESDYGELVCQALPDNSGSGQPGISMKACNG